MPRVPVVDLPIAAFVAAGEGAVQSRNAPDGEGVAVGIEDAAAAHQEGVRGCACGRTGEWGAPHRAGFRGRRLLSTRVQYRDTSACQHAEDKGKKSEQSKRRFQAMRSSRCFRSRMSMPRMTP